MGINTIDNFTLFVVKYFVCAFKKKEKSNSCNIDNLSYSHAHLVRVGQLAHVYLYMTRLTVKKTFNAETLNGYLP